ncbi:MAG: thiamine pyrophosphate-dependent enzyme [Planctomycetota bacterium]|nr:thiamine pyrophosphate-dependent enzyme [Planctomycetota bacterium]MDI6786800.1 thiamine pyrophosphate-dependent enzyme [Planctomycetota bacterium]
MNHPFDYLLREDRIPHIWCSGCGLGIALHSFLRAVQRSNIPVDKMAIVSGIGCTGRTAGYVKMDSFHTTHGRAIPFATGLKLANPNLKVVIFSGDGDLIAIGGNHFIHAARRNVDITVICVNNFNYGMTGGQSGPSTPLKARTATSPYGNQEPPFNLAYLAAGSGAVFVSRWTVAEPRRLEASISKALNKQGFSFVEILSPCPTLYGRMNKYTSALDMLVDYQKNTVINEKVNLKDAQLELGGKIILGDFIDIQPGIAGHPMPLSEKVELEHTNKKGTEDE